jgi:hypothetical protein
MSGRLPLSFILATVMIDSMGIGLILPVMPSLIEEVGGSRSPGPRSGAASSPPPMR